MPESTPEPRGYERTAVFRQEMARQLKTLIDKGTITVEEALIEAMQIEAYACLAGQDIGEFELRNYREALSKERAHRAH